MQNVLRWCDPAAAFQKSIYHERGTIAPCPNISVDREKVGVVYYWTGWCIDPPGSGPDFGGLAALLSSLSFPQHQSRWLQLPTDQRCNGLASRGKARPGCARKTRHAGEVEDFYYRAEQIDRRDAVMSDLQRGLRTNLYPVRAHRRSEPRNKWECCFLFEAWFLYFQYLVINGRTDPLRGLFVLGFLKLILHSANGPSLKKKFKYKHNKQTAVSVYSELEDSQGI